MVTWLQCQQVKKDGMRTAPSSTLDAPADLLLVDRFERIVVINLPSRADRRSEMGQQLAAVGLAWDAPMVRRFDAIRPSDRGGFPSVGARGCFLSHLGVLREARDAGARNVLIMEDDIDFSAHLASQWPPVSRDLASDAWSFFYGGHVIDGAAPSAHLHTWVVPPDTPVQTAHFLGVRGAAIAELVAYLEAMLGRVSGDAAGGPMHVDGAYSWFRREHPHHVTIAASVQLGVQRPSRTDIHPLRWFDRWTGVRNAVELARRLCRWARAQSTSKRL
jgi:glycosyl transferase, family 25